MRSPQNYLIAVLALATCATATLAWRQHKELTALRTAASQSARVEKPKTSTDAPSRPLPSAVTASALPDPTDAAQPANLAESEPPIVSQRREDARQRGRSMMDDPDMQRFMALQRKSHLDARYAALFRALNLPPDQLDRFKNLLVEKSTAVSDVIAAAREQGINRRSDRDAVNKLVASTQAEIDENIRAALGEVAYAQYRDYEQTLPHRAVTTQLEQRLSYSSTPLTPEQSAQLVRILSATNNSPGNFGPVSATGNPGEPSFSGGGRAMITDATINQALGVLAAPQLEALRQLQQEQQVQAELNAAMRRRFQAAPASGQNPAPSSAPAAPRGGG